MFREVKIENGSLKLKISPILKDINWIKDILIFFEFVTFIIIQWNNGHLFNYIM